MLGDAPAELIAMAGELADGSIAIFYSGKFARVAECLWTCCFDHREELGQEREWEEYEGLEGCRHC